MINNVLAELGNIPVSMKTVASLYPHISAGQKKVQELEKAGDIIRLKRGLYVVSPDVSGKTLSTELIANHLYSPSYISMSSALRLYGMIPETVYTMQSMTIKHSRIFDTPLGNFDYTCMSRECFPIGLRQMANDDGTTFIIATPEKALSDLIANSPKVNLRYLSEVETFLEEDIRFATDALPHFDIDILRQYAQCGKKANSINTLIKYLSR